MTAAAASVRSPRRSALARLCRTPMRDLVRGQVTGRLDRDALLADANLPEPLPQLVRQVVRRTRLFRLEKVAVAEELMLDLMYELPEHEPNCRYVIDEKIVLGKASLHTARKQPKKKKETA